MLYVLLLLAVHDYNYPCQFLLQFIFLHLHYILLIAYNPISKFLKKCGYAVMLTLLC